jgi:hypothetical protein
MNAHAVQAPAANTLGMGRRVGYAAVSALSAWLISQVVCLPFNLIVAVRDTEGQAKLFVETLLYGLAAWAGWTLLLSSVAWVVLVLPLVLTLRPCLLVRLRRWVLLLALLASVAAMISQWHAFLDMGGVNLYQRFRVMLPYGCFGLSYAGVTAAMYIQLSQRRLDAKRD